MTPEELSRYERSIQVIGQEGQEKLKQAKVLIIGLGGLGAPASLYLTAAGIGTLGLLDHDKVEESNLQRQPIYSSEDVGKSKALSAKKALEKINPLIRMEVYQEKLTEENSHLLESYDIILDCTDSLQSKHLINRACRSLKKPLVYGAAVGEEGMLAVFLPDGPCLACLKNSREAPSCSSEGVLPAVPGTIGLLQAGEVLKLALGRPPIKDLLTFSLESGFRSFSLSKNPECPACLGLPEEESKEISPEQLPTLGNHQLVDIREPSETPQSLENSIKIPLSTLSQKLSSLDNAIPVVLYCQTGSRSLYAAGMLQKKGFQTFSLKGGIVGLSNK